MNLISMDQVRTSKGVSSIDWDDTGSMCAKNENGKVVLQAERSGGLQYIDICAAHQLNDCTRQITASSPIMHNRFINAASQHDTTQHTSPNPIHSSSSSSTTAPVHTQSTAVSEMHKKLGHPGRTMMHRMLMSGALEGMVKKDVIQSTVNCDGCMKGKFQEPGYKHVISPFVDAQYLGDIVSADLMGPVYVPSLSKSLYAMNVVEHYSGYAFIVLLTKKSEAPNELIAVLKRIHTQHHSYPTRLLTDNGREFINEVVQSFCREHGITPVQSPPYAPQHNGKVERLNGTLKRMARTMLAEAHHAPHALWGEALHAAVYTYNRAFIRDGEKSTPYQLYNNTSEAFNTGHLHILFSTVLYKIQEVNIQNKFSNVANEGVLVGYAERSGYRVLVIDDNKPRVIVTAHVRVREGDFSALAKAREMLIKLKLEPKPTPVAVDTFESIAFDNETQLAIINSLADREDANIQLIEQSLVEQEAAQQHEDEQQQLTDELNEAYDTRHRLEEEKEKVMHELTVAEDTSIDDSPIPSAITPRRSTRTPAPRLRYGGGDPSLYGQSMASHVKCSDSDDTCMHELRTIEYDLTKHVFGIAAATTLSMVMRKKIEVKPGDEPIEKQLKTIQAIQESRPIDPNRPKPDENGQIVMPSVRCIARSNRTGKQCRLRTRNGGMCHVHLEYNAGLRIKPSLIKHAGKGLFAERPFNAGDRITDYTGELMKNSDVERGLSNYVIQINKNESLDAARTDTAPGRLVNDPRGTSKRANTKFIVDHRRKVVRIVALRNIKKGEELLVSYGPAYWKNAIEKKRGIKASGISTSTSPTSYSAIVSSPATIDTDPTTHNEAMQQRDASHWRAAEAAEEASLEEHNTFTPVDALPPGEKLVSLKYIYKKKYDASGNIIKYKARIVARGFTQRQGIDYDETMAQVISIKSLRILFSHAAFTDQEIDLLDVETAFLHAPLTRPHYVIVPPGIQRYAPGTILRVNRALYGFCESPREWNHTLVAQLVKMEYSECRHTDPCVFIKSSKTGRTMTIGVYVDDMPLFYDARDAAEMQDDKKKLMSKFKIKDMGAIKELLGVRITRDRAAHIITLDQQTYTNTVLQQFGFDACKPASTPATIDSTAVEKGDLQQGACEIHHDMDTHAQVNTSNYRSVVGTLNYLAVTTRPDIAQAVNNAARHISAPTSKSVVLIKRILRYLKKTSHIGITYSDSDSTSSIVHAYGDSDWGGDINDRKSTTGWVVILHGAAISWCSQKQSSVALSTTEAEYVAMCDLAREIEHVRALMNNMLLPQVSSTIIYCDNQSAIQIASSESITKRRKHIDIKHHYIRDLLLKKVVNVQWCDTTLQQADILTKPLAQLTFEHHRNAIMGIHYLLSCSHASPT